MRAAEQPLPQQPAHPQRGRAQHLVPGAVGALLGQPHDVAALAPDRARRTRRAAAPRCRRPRRARPARPCGRPRPRGPRAARRRATCRQRRRGVADRRRAPRPRPAAARPSGRAAGPPAPAPGPRPPRRAGRRRPGRRACPAAGPPRRPCRTVSSAVATPVTRSTSSWASSTTTTSCSGSTGRPSSASMASSAWLVTTMSARPASARAFSAKQSSPTGQRDAPRHSRAVTDTCRQVASVTPGTSSSRSPVSVVVGPLVQALDRAAHRGDRERVEQLVGRVVVVAAVQLVQAQVVAAALEDRERRCPAEQRLERLRQARQIAVDELALQGDGGRRDHDRGARWPRRGGSPGTR